MAPSPQHALDALSTQAEAIARNMHHIMAHEAKAQPRPMASTTVTRGFEATAFPKIVRTPWQEAEHEGGG
jgi:hypothetical protein